MPATRGGRPSPSIFDGVEATEDNRIKDLDGRSDKRSEMRILNAILLTLLVVLQFKLWFGDGGLRELWQLENAVELQNQQNQQLIDRNQSLAAEVNDLKTGTEALEERARSELGLVQPDEEFVQVVESRPTP